MSLVQLKSISGPDVSGPAIWLNSANREGAVPNFSNVGGPAVLALAAVLALLLIAVIGGGLILTGVLGARGDQRWRLMPLGLGLVILVPLVACVVAVNIPAQAKTITWDFSQTHTIAQLDGPPNGNVYAYEGDIDLNLRLPGNRTFGGRAKLVACRTEGDQITDLTLNTAPLNTQEAYALGTRLIEGWGFDRGNFGDWYANNDKYLSEGKFYSTYLNTTDPSLGLEIRPSLDNTSPWFITLKVSWR